MGEWTAVGKDFCLVDATDHKVLIQGILPWSDILDVEIHPVLETEKDMLGLLKK